MAMQVNTLLTWTSSIDGSPDESPQEYQPQGSRQQPAQWIPMHSHAPAANRGGNLPDIPVDEAARLLPSDSLPSDAAQGPTSRGGIFARGTPGAVREIELH